MERTFSGGGVCCVSIDDDFSDAVDEFEDDNARGLDN